MASRIIDGLEYDTDKSEYLGQVKTSGNYWDGPRMTYNYLNVYRSPGGRHFTSDQNGDIAAVSDDRLKALAGKSPSLYRTLYGEPKPA